MAEKEFVAAKLLLHKASESKELLSEHLCAIIQQNEARKAQKLADLLRTLKLENSGVTTPGVVVDPGAVLFHKTPTPGVNIWPHERLPPREPIRHSSANSITFEHNILTQVSGIAKRNSYCSKTDAIGASENLAAEDTVVAMQDSNLAKEAAAITMVSSFPEREVKNGKDGDSSTCTIPSS